MWFLPVLSHRCTERNINTQDFYRLLIVRAVHGKPKEGAGGREKEQRKKITKKEP
jgi:hypothetical protein